MSLFNRKTDQRGWIHSQLTAGILLCIVLLFGGLLWRSYLAGQGPGLDMTLLRSPGQFLPTLHHPFLEFLKLFAAFLIGRLITAVHQKSHIAEPISPSMGQAQVLLCVSGALMMIIIGDSLARAFGVAGGAAIVRFRTPIENPRDAMVLFLLLGLGMACGLGAFALAGLTTGFLLLLLHFSTQAALPQTRQLALQVSAQEIDPAAAHVRSVLANRGFEVETRGIAEGEPNELSYRVTLDAAANLDELTKALKSDSASRILSVSWGGAKEGKKRSQAAKGGST